jgi:anaerobic ribonucleoside-triphosphate reductase
MSIEKNIKQINCHDCQKQIEINQEEIVNGKKLVYDNNGEKIEIFKCQDCFEKDETLKNYQPCEVYSRVVGYLRPVQQWNEGKQEEYSDRKEYQV